MEEKLKLSTIIGNSKIILNLRSKSKNGVLKELVSHLQMEPEAKDILMKALINREEMGSTSVGKGIAIPHARTLLVKEFNLIIGLSKRGIPFDAPDNKPSRLFFLLIAPPQEPSNSYLIALGKIAELARAIAKDGRLFNAVEEGEFLRIMEEIEQGGT
jgi:mannitol/fructose-specific phosphotransferase system IIA component (Ntr-type)